MHARERVEITLAHQKADRPPMSFHYTPEFEARLDADPRMLALKAASREWDGGPRARERALGVDILEAEVGWVTGYYLDTKPYRDEWGVGWEIIPYETPFGIGHYTEPAGHPLADDGAIPGYQPPDPERPALYRAVEELLHRFKDRYWIVGNVHTTIFETAWALRGFEKMMLDMAINPGLVEQLLDIPFHYHRAVARNLVSLGVDMIFLGDDLGTQTQMLMSPTMWRSFLKPRMRAIISDLKGMEPDLQIAYHTDGYVEPIIPDLIEIGVDVLNPVQPACMDPAKIKATYGDALSLWGTIDEQHTLPFGSPDDVTNEVRLRLETAGHDGGLILGPTHNVQLDTPLENFWAMVDAILSSG